MQTTRDPIVGIDLGTTNSLVAWSDPVRGGGPRVLPDGAGRRLLPSVVRYGTGGRAEAVGVDARDHAQAFPTRTIASVKRLMGRSRRDAEGDLPYLSYEVIEGPNRTARVRLPGPEDEPGAVVSPQEVSAVILGALREQASAALGVPVRRAVVTVPAYFDDAQRQATRDAGRLAGLEVVRILNEPTAAALAYGIGLGRRRAETIAVFDLGGGTFDVSILSVVPGAALDADDASGASAPATDVFQVLATAGDTHLGGDDIDQMLVRLMIDELAVANAGAAPVLDAGDRQRLRAGAEALKIELSTSSRAALRARVGAASIDRLFERAELERLIGPWLERAIGACARALADAGLAAGAVDRVVMVGGSTRIPLVRRRASEFFGKEVYTALDPDEVVALGAAVQASILAGAGKDTLLVDVIPLSLGIETVGGAVAKLIVRNSSVPARATERFSTSVDGQTSIKLHVLQGEREMVADCRSLGEFHLRGIPPMPAGMPKLEVEFLVDASGVLSVRAVEQRSGARASLQVVPNHGLTRDEVERIERESLVHAREDMARHRVVDLVTNSMLDLKWIGDRLRLAGADLDAPARDALEQRMRVVAELVESARRDWQSVDPDVLYAAKNEMDRASLRLHELSIARTLRDGAPASRGADPGGGGGAGG